MCRFDCFNKIKICLVQQYSRDDSAINEENRQIKCESSPPTPRSLRLERVVAALGNTTDETQRYTDSGHILHVPNTVN